MKQKFLIRKRNKLKPFYPDRFQANNLFRKSYVKLGYGAMVRLKHIK